MVNISPCLIQFTWTIPIVCLLLILIALYTKYKWQFLQKYGIHGPLPTLMKMGHITKFLDRKFFLNDLKMIEEYGPVIGRYIGTSPRVMISDPDILKKIMMKEFKSFPDRQDRMNKLAGKAFNQSLLTTSGDTWRRQRSTLTPTFASSKLKQMLPIMDHCIKSAVFNLFEKIKIGKGVINAKDEFGSISIN